MSAQITHRQDENGVMRQIVSPAELRRILKANGDTLSRPKDFGPDDEWIVKDPAAVSLGRRGGKATSPAKTRSSAANGAKGGRPRYQWYLRNDLTGETISKHTTHDAAAKAAKACKTCIYDNISIREIASR